jgi:perosamine synthetase
MTTTRFMHIPITKPLFGPEELRAVQRPLETGWVVQGPYVRQFEERFAAFAGSAHGIATTSCTTALHLVPAFTWVATANVVEYMGATPVFCDIDLATFNIDPAQFESLITKRTVGVIPVHLFGLCADMAAIGSIAERRGLWVVEDAACGFGARIDGRHSGSFGVMGCFSFHPRKAITTGEGGLVTTDRADLAELLSSLRDHGASRSDLTRHHGARAHQLADYPHLGYNFRMTDIQGALGCAQMDRADWVLAERQRLARRYDEALGGLDWLVTPVVPAGYEHGYQSYVCLFAPEQATVHAVARLHERRNQLMDAMEARGIATRPGTHAPVLVEYYRERYGFAEDAFPNALLADRLSLSLPLFPQMTDEEQTFVHEALADWNG